MNNKFSQRKEQTEIKFNNNRLNFLLAIIFLLFMAIILKLYNVQIINNEKYVAKAERQHKIYSELVSERGKIYLKNNNSDLYPLAMNKDFAVIYVNPKALKTEQRDKLLEVSFNAFHREAIEKEVDNLLKQEDQDLLNNELKYIDTLNLPADECQKKKDETQSRYQSLALNPEWSKFRQDKRDLEINERRQGIVNDYLQKIDVSDKYSRVLKRKLEKDDLLKFYFEYFKDIYSLSTSSDLLLKSGKIMLGDKDISSEIWGLHYEWESLRYYPEKNIFSSVLGFSNLDKIGSYGLEGYFNNELKGEDGFLLGDKGSYQGRKIIIDKEEYLAPVDGNNLVLTIDYAVQLFVCQKLKEAQDKHKFTSGSAIVMDPKTGKIISMCLWPGFDPNNYSEVKDPALFDNETISHQYEPGSVFKTITMAIAIDQEKVTPSTTYEDKGQLLIKGWSKPIKNSDFSVKGGHGVVDMTYVLENSLNTGAIFAANKVGPQVYAEYLKKFGFGQKTGIDLTSEVSGNIENVLKDKVKEIDFATASFGQGIAVTPIQMIASYAALANKGVLMKPYIVDQILDSNNNVIQKTEAQEVRRVVSEQTAETVSAMLVNVVENGHAKKSQVAGYYVGGKTGTAQIPSPRGGYLENQYIHNFIGYAPISDPKFVLLVKFDNPKTSIYAEGTVVPVFGEIIDFLLKYYQVPKER